MRKPSQEVHAVKTAEVVALAVKEIDYIRHGLRA